MREWVKATSLQQRCWEWKSGKVVQQGGKTLGNQIVIYSFQIPFFFLKKLLIDLTAPDVSCSTREL